MTEKGKEEYSKPQGNGIPTEGDPPESGQNSSTSGKPSKIAQYLPGIISVLAAAFTFGYTQIQSIRVELWQHSVDSNLENYNEITKTASQLIAELDDAPWLNESETKSIVIPIASDAVKDSYREFEQLYWQKWPSLINDETRCRLRFFRRNLRAYLEARYDPDSSGVGVDNRSSVSLVSLRKQLRMTGETLRESHERELNSIWWPFNSEKDFHCGTDSRNP